MENKSALITGASGFIGTRLVRHLRSRGVETIRALDIAEPREVLSGVDYLKVDVTRPIDTALGAGVGVIYNLAATHRTPGHQPDEYYNTNVLGALNVCNFARRSGIDSIVFTSSISVYGPSEEPLTEDSGLRPVSDYGRSKRMAELIHTQWCEQADDRKLVIVRPGVVYGPGEGGNYTTLARALRSGRFVYPGRKDAIKGGGYVDELLSAMDFALSHDDRSVIFNFSFPDESTTEDIVKAFGAVAGFKDNYFTLPLLPLLPIAFAFEIAAHFGVKTAIHRERLLKLVQSTRVTPGWLLKRGYTFTHDLRSALIRWRDESSGRFI